MNDVKKLKFPDGCFPIIHGCGCLTGNFAYYDTFGELCYYSNLYAMKQYNDYEAERHYRKCHLFGDCSMTIWKTVPEKK